MPISQTVQVFRLVKSLTKSEKRNFSLYASRIQDPNTILYLKLFEIYDKQICLNEEAVMIYLGNVSKSQYSNLKRHLFSQILISLRHLHKEKLIHIKISEFIDFARILYSKGHYMEALKFLEKGKKMALKHHTDFFTLTIIELEKMIQSRHITRFNKNDINTLIDQANKITTNLINRSGLSNLKVSMHRYYIEKGHVTNDSEHQDIKIFFNKNLEKVSVKNLGMMEKIFLYQSYVWLYYILDDFKRCFKYTLKWVELFEKNPELLHRDVDLYLRGYHYLLTSAYNNKDLDTLSHYLDKLELFRNSNYSKFNNNTKIFSFLYAHSSRLNLHFLKGTFEQGALDSKKTVVRMKRYAKHLDQHKVMILNYKMAWMHLANGSYNNANKYLMEVITLGKEKLRDDIQIYSRLMHLMMHYDEGSFEIMP